MTSSYTPYSEVYSSNNSRGHDDVYRGYNGYNPQDYYDGSQRGERGREEDYDNSRKKLDSLSRPEEQGALENGDYRSRNVEGYDRRIGRARNSRRRRSPSSSSSSSSGSQSPVSEPETGRRRRRRRDGREDYDPYQNRQRHERQQRRAQSEQPSRQAKIAGHFDKSMNGAIAAAAGAGLGAYTARQFAEKNKRGKRDDTATWKTIGGALAGALAANAAEKEWSGKLADKAERGYERSAQ